MKKAKRNNEYGDVEEDLSIGSIFIFFLIGFSFILTNLYVAVKILHI